MNAMHPLIDNEHFVPPDSQKPAKEHPQNCSPAPTVIPAVPQQQVKPATNSIPPQRAQKLYLRVPDMTSHVFRKVENLLDIFDGFLPVIFYDSATKTYIPSNRRISLTPVCYAELKLLLGEDNVVPK
jgi:DNA polymerase-3 subunit alpha